MANRQRKATDSASFLKSMVSNYSLTLVLFALFLLTWAGQFVAQLIEMRNEATQHGESFQFLDFLPAFWQATLENWQSEFLQLLAFVGLTSFLIHKGSPESKDGDEEMQAKLDSIQQELRELRRARAA
jgi:hypothetical protein